MPPRRRPTADLDDEILALEREVAAATGSGPPAPATPPREARLDRARKTGGSLVRRLLAVAVLIAAAAILLKIVIGVIAGIVWILVAVAAVVAILWAVRQL